MSILIGLLLGLPLCPWNADRREEPAPGPSDQPGAWLYEEGSIHDFAFELTPDAVDLLGRDEPDVHARMTYMGVSWDVGFKLKRSSTYPITRPSPTVGTSSPGAKTPRSGAGARCTRGFGGGW